MAHTDHIGYVSYADLANEYHWLLGEQQDALDADDIERQKETDRRIAATEAQMERTNEYIAGLRRRIAELTTDVEDFEFTYYVGIAENERKLAAYEELEALRAELQSLLGEIPF